MSSKYNRVKKHSRPNTRRTLLLESLESREVFNATLWNLTGDGVLRLSGTVGSDVVTVTGKQGHVDLSWANRGTAKFDHVKRIEFNGGDGNDIFRAAPDFDLPILANGGSGNDRIEAGLADDVLTDLSGINYLFGGDGNDVLTGTEAGGLYGGNGKDILDGSSALDVIETDNGRLYLQGSPANDVIKLYRNDGRVYVEANGRDVSRSFPMPNRIEINGMEGNDTISNDTVLVTTIIHGGSGDDILCGLNDTTPFTATSATTPWKATKTGTILGTPAFMSPEQAAAQTVDARSDLFSLGGVLFAMTTGQMPFRGSDMFSLLRSLAVDTPPTVKSINPSVPTALSDLIAQLLEKQPSRRPASGAEVAGRLAEIASATVSPQTSSLPPKPRAGIALGILGVALLLGAIVITIERPNGMKMTINVPDDANLNLTVTADKQDAGPERGVDADGNVGKPDSTSGYREAVQRLLSRGAELTIIPLNGTMRLLKGTVELPTEAFAVREVRLFANQPYQDEFLRDLTKLPTLTTVYLNMLPVTDTGAEILSNILSLEHIVIPGSELTDRGIRHLARLPRLKSLFIDKSPYVTTAAMAELASHRDLVQLRWNDSATDESLIALEGFESLVRLGLGGNSPGGGIRGPGLRHLKDCKQLQDLGFDNCNFDRQAFQHLPKLPMLKQLVLNYSPIDTASLECLPVACPQLQIVSLEGSGINDEGVLALIKLPHLESLRLVGTNITDKSLDQLGTVPKMKSINVRACPVTADGVKALRDKLPLCSIESDF